MLNFDKITEVSKERYILSEKALNSILEKAVLGKELNLEDAAALLSIENDEWFARLLDTALKVKERVFGKRIVLFAPLYLSNECVNQCLYCAFQAGNLKEKRKTLTIDEAIKEANFLVKRGFRRTLLVTAENKAKCSVDYIVSVTKELYQKTGLRIIHLNAAPMEVEELSEIRNAGIGVFQVFQETYNKETYEKLHVKGKKADFNYRLTCMNRALEAGFKDVGIGALLGLYDYKFDVLSVIAHAKFLKKEYGTYPHTISVPRFRHALGAKIDVAPFPVDDRTFKKIVAVYRLAVPTAGIVVSTREQAKLRDEIIFCGASQISAESSTSPGGYTNSTEEENSSQFSLSDRRSLEEVILAILEKGMQPSFCTACYKKGREGGHFHELAGKGLIKDFCEKNAYSSFLEYLETLHNEALKNDIKEKMKQVFGFKNEVVRGHLV